jgi:K(+)-stimulated pyrophosphate-energized sodium pump
VDDAPKYDSQSTSFTNTGVFLAILVGSIVGALMSIVTEYYTAIGKRPVNSIVRQSETGAATNIIGGLSVGMESTLIPTLILQPVFIYLTILPVYTGLL